MQPVEQAVLISPNADGGANDPIVARSPGVCQADARELAVWCPSRDSLLGEDPGVESLSFHPLPSGAYAVSRTAIEDGGRNGRRQQVVTRCLVVPPDVLGRFGNNPFALARAPAVQCALRAGAPHGPSLEPLAIGGGAPAIERSLLEHLAAEPGPESMAVLVHAACEARCLAVGGPPAPAALIAGLFSCLPPECRLEFSFSTGLKFSPRRPFRIVALSGDPAQRQWIAHCSNVTALELPADAAWRATPLGGWAQWIQRTLATGQIALLAAETSKRRFRLTPADLPALGLQLLEEFDVSELGGRDDFGDAMLESQAWRDRRAHAAHHQFAGSPVEICSPPATTPASAPASTGLHPDSPEVLDKLEQLDDLVYDAINGRSGVMEQLQEAWPTLLDQLGERLLMESREQYLRYALSVWDQCAAADGVRDCSKAIQALDVLCLLFGEA
jgi:hypothetical protein